MTVKKGYKHTEKSLYNYKLAAQKRLQDPEYCRRQKEGCQNRNKDFYKDPEWIRKNKEGAQKRSQNPEWIRKNKERSLEWRYNHKEGLLGGFWYGNVRYPDPIKYCELWCPDLWHRIDEAQNYQSILSGKTKIDNGGKSLSRHHVYWQPKACCEWDEDTQGYYAMINIGTAKYPFWYKHYIKGDPNKFVLLTSSEHQMVKKDKFAWIEIFEELIETKLGGVCYLPKPIYTIGDK